MFMMDSRPIPDMSDCRVIAQETNMRKKIVIPPKFTINDPVVVTSPCADSGKTGRICEIYQSSGMYRFVVDFDDGSIAVFFGFELTAKPSNLVSIRNAAVNKQPRKDAFTFRTILRVLGVGCSEDSSL
jgi:hypothetical protein